MNRAHTKIAVAFGILGLAGTAATAPLLAARGPTPVVSSPISPRIVTAQQGHARFLVGARLSIPARLVVRITRVSTRRVMKTVVSSAIHRSGRAFLLIQATDSLGYQLPQGAYTVFIGATSAGGRNARGHSYALTLNYSPPRGVFDWYTVPNDGDIRTSLKLHTSSGQVVAAVHPGGAVASAGILRGDVIQSINGLSVASAGGYARAVRLMPASTPVTIQLLRGTTPLTKTITAPPDWTTIPSMTSQLGAAAATKAFGYGYALVAYDVSIGHFGPATRIIGAWSRADAATATAHIARAQLMAAERRLPTALTYWTKALALNGTLAQAAFGQGIAYDAIGNDAAAANAFAHAARLDGASAADPAYQALALEQAHLPYLAIPPAGAAVSIDSTDPNALAAEGVALIQTGQRAVGVSALEHGVVLTDDPARAQLLISTFLEASVP
jgi:membrane-associated protease RseP (regulator of RpoE activity)